MLHTAFHPGQLVEYRADPRSPWLAALVEQIEDQGDRNGIFTAAIVPPQWSSQCKSERLWATARDGERVAGCHSRV